MSYKVIYTPGPPPIPEPCDIPDVDEYPVGTEIKCTTQHGIEPGRGWVPPCHRIYELRQTRFKKTRYWKETTDYYGW